MRTVASYRAISMERALRAPKPRKKVPRARSNKTKEKARWEVVRAFCELAPLGVREGYDSREFRCRQHLMRFALRASGWRNHGA
eukprot:7914936-Pyramimonas_sp.AAC.1